MKELVEPFRPYLVQPDHTFYLRCTDATLRDRMAGKQDCNQDDDMVNVPGLLTRLRTNLDKIAAADPTGVIIDTDDKTPAQLADTITPTSRKRAHAPASGRLRGRRPHQRRPGSRPVLPQRRTRGDFPSRWPQRDPGETPEDCARRELKEEAGVEATRWQHLGTYAITLGNNARLSLFLA